MEKFFFAKMCDSILKKKDQLKIKMEKKLRYRKRRFQLLEVNYLDWETFSSMMHLDQPIVPILQSLELITNSKLLDYLCKKNLSF